MKRSGKIQSNYNATKTNKEKYFVYSFSGIFDFVVKLVMAYKKKSDKIYVFFDKPVKNVPRNTVSL